MQLFEITDILFSNPKKWDSIPRGEKKKNQFMINRMMSIQFPLQAQAFNHIKIDPVAMTNSWQLFMSKLYKKTPFWMYTKGAKKKKEEKQKKQEISESIIKKYASLNNLDLKSVRDAIEYFPESSIKELKKLEKLIQ